MNRELVMLAHTYVEDKYHFAGWRMSEKMDGQRAIWIKETRGLPIAQVPFANRALDSRDHICTGLWTRTAKVIHAPNFWLDQLPDVWLDGELHIERNQSQLLQSTVTKLNPDPYMWKLVKYHVFDIPSLFYLPGTVENKEYIYTFPKQEIEYQTPTFEQSYLKLRSIDLGEYATVLEQVALSRSLPEAKDQVERKLEEVSKVGGEGVIVRSPNSFWSPMRSHSMLKIKPRMDSEAKIVGYIAGKGKFRGLVGAFKVEWNGHLFDLSGFTDNERRLDSVGAEYAYQNPGQLIKNGSCVQFPIGTIVTFKYRKLSSKGIPIEAQFFRKEILK